MSKGEEEGEKEVEPLGVLLLQDGPAGGREAPVCHRQRQHSPMTMSRSPNSRAA